MKRATQALGLIVALAGGFAFGDVGERTEARVLMENQERNADALYELTKATLEATERWPPSGSAYELWLMVEALERSGDQLERRYRDTRGFSGVGDALERIGRELARLDALAPLILPPGRALELLADLAEDHERLVVLLGDESRGPRGTRPERRGETLNARDRRRAGQALEDLDRVIDRMLPMMPDPPAPPELPDWVGDGTMDVVIDPNEAADALRADTSDLFVDPDEAHYVRRGMNAVYDELRIWMVLSMRLAEGGLSGRADAELRREAAQVLRVGRYVDRALRRFDDDLPPQLVEAWKEAREPQVRLARVLGLPEPRL